MAATRVYSTAAYYVAAIVAILLGLCPKFGALVNIIPGGVLGGITVVLYGMIGLLGAKIWKENRVDFANPINLVPLAAGIIIAIGNVTLKFTDTFSLVGHRARHDRRGRRLAPRPRAGAAELREALQREGAHPAAASTASATCTATRTARPVVGRRVSEAGVDVGAPRHRPERARSTGETRSLPLRRPRHPRRGPRGPVGRG